MGSEDGRCHSSLPKEQETEKTCTKVKCELVDYDSLPEYLKDNEFVVGYYRAEWPLKETILSIFSIHNETINVWTHLIGFFIFLVLTICSAVVIPRGADLPSAQQIWDVIVSGSDLYKVQKEVAACLPYQTSSVVDEMNSSFPLQQMLPSLTSWHVPEILANCLPQILYSAAANHSNPCILQSVKEDMTSMITPILERPISRWPFFAFLFGSMFCLLTSSVCHLISCHSERMAYIMLRLDYTGVSALIVTSFYPVVYYSFLCHPFFSNLYMAFITTFGAATVLVSLVPVFQTAEYRTVRAGLFFCMGLSGLVPIMHKLVLFHNLPEVLLSTWYELLMGVFYGLGVTVYTTRVPERWMPGRFDLVGHSHQLFHVLVIAGACSHYLAGMVYLNWRDLERC